jgi:hypothetical protein
VSSLFCGGRLAGREGAARRDTRGVLGGDARRGSIRCPTENTPGCAVLWAVGLSKPVPYGAGPIGRVSSGLSAQSSAGAGRRRALTSWRAWLRLATSLLKRCSRAGFSRPTLGFQTTVRSTTRCRRFSSRCVLLTVSAARWGAAVRGRSCGSVRGLPIHRRTQGESATIVCRWMAFTARRMGLGCGDAAWPCD